MTCSVASCHRDARAGGVCGAHYQRRWEHGDIQPDVPIKPFARRIAGPEMHRTCTLCGATHPLGEFPRDKKRPSGHTRHCRECARRMSRRHMRKRNGWSDELVERVFSEQGGRCALCSIDLTERTTRADHDHSTGKPRGLLCDHCNKGLGHFKDNPAALAAAIEYLNHHSREESRP